MTQDLPTPAQAKREARRLRAERAARGTAISHAQALESIARRYGFREWNALHAAIRDRIPDAWAPGGRVSGRYLSQPFVATVLSAERLPSGWVRIALDLDTAVDVVRFGSFTNLRKRVFGTVGPDGHSRDRTSDGRPHLRLDL
jgi:hypothetical protein